jgi:hypothetical protein
MVIDDEEDIDMKTDDLVPLTDYDDRTGETRAHSRDYKALKIAGEEGLVSLVQDKKSGRLYVSKSEADAYLKKESTKRYPEDCGFVPADVSHRFDLLEEGLASAIALVRKVAHELGVTE